MKKIINEYEYTEDKINESVSAWWVHKYKKNTYIILAITALAFVLFFMKHKIFTLILGIIIPVIYFFVLLNKIRTATNLELKAVRSLDKIPTFKVTLGEQITLEYNNKKNNFSYDIIQSYLITTNLIVIIAKGYKTIALSKDGFIEGTMEDAILLLDEKLGK